MSEMCAVRSIVSVAVADAINRQPLTIRWPPAWEANCGCGAS